MGEMLTLIPPAARTIVEANRSSNRSGNDNQKKARDLN